jgi:hypothetical protein
VQLVAAHPVHDDAPAAAFTVSPCPPLLKKVDADISFFTFLLLHEGQSGCSLPKTRHSKSLLHLSQWYS